jgi:hypothetical protein
MEKFLEELAKNDVKAFHRSRSVYRVNDKKVSIRTTTKLGPIYWYDISESIMNGVDYFIYQANSPSHFVLFPSTFFKECYRNLRDSNRPNAKQFYIDWTHKTLVSNPGFSQNIASYCCSTQLGENAGTWRSVFLSEELS